MRYKSLLSFSLMGLLMGVTPAFADSQTSLSEELMSTSQTQSLLEQHNEPEQSVTQHEVSIISGDRNESIRGNLSQKTDTTSCSFSSSDTTIAEEDKQTKGIFTKIIHGKITFEGGIPNQKDIELKDKKNIPLDITLNDGKHENAEVPLINNKGTYYYSIRAKKDQIIKSVEIKDPVWASYYTITNTGKDLIFSRSSIDCTVSFDNAGTSIIPGKVTPLLEISGEVFNQSPSYKNKGTYTYKVPTGKISEVQFMVDFPNEKKYQEKRISETSLQYTVSPSYSERKAITGNIYFKGDTEQTRPKIITIKVYDDANRLVDTIQTSASQNWAYESRQLLVNDSNGKPIHYTVKSSPIPFYQGPNIQNFSITYNAKWCPVPIQKVESNKKTPLTGGIIKIIDCKTGETILPVHGKLPSGHTYKISTLVPPTGYQAIQQPIQIRVLEDGTLEQYVDKKWIPVDQVTLYYQKRNTSYPNKPTLSIEDLANKLGVDVKELIAQVGQNKFSKLKDKLEKGIDMPTLPELPNFDLPSIKSLPSLPNFPSMDSSLDLSGLPNLDSDLSLPDFSTLDSELPNLDFGSDLGLEPLADVTESPDDLSNGGLGNFDDLFNDDSGLDILPQTGEIKQKGLVIIGFIIIIGLAIYAGQRFIAHRKNK